MTDYEILGVLDNASIEDIKKAYRRLAFLFHPDRNTTKGADKEFIKITEAYERLMGKTTIPQIQWEVVTYTYPQQSYIHKRQEPDGRFTTIYTTSKKEYDTLVAIYGESL